MVSRLMQNSVGFPKAHCEATGTFGTGSPGVEVTGVAGELGVGEFGTTLVRPAVPSSSPFVELGASAPSCALRLSPESSDSAPQPEAARSPPVATADRSLDSSSWCDEDVTIPSASHVESRRASERPPGFAEQDSAAETRTSELSLENSSNSAAALAEAGVC
jgi:hypothetical protein